MEKQIKLILTNKSSEAFTINGIEIKASGKTKLEIPRTKADQLVGAISKLAIEAEIIGDALPPAKNTEGDVALTALLAEKNEKIIELEAKLALSEQHNTELQAKLDELSPTPPAETETPPTVMPDLDTPELNADIEAQETTTPPKKKGKKKKGVK